MTCQSTDFQLFTEFFPVSLGFQPVRRLVSVQPKPGTILLSEMHDSVERADSLPAEKQGFDELFLEHYPRLVKTLLRLVGSSGQAEELAAEAFYRLHQHRSQNGAENNSAGWLYRTAMNLGLDALRANSRRVRREEQAQRESSGSPVSGNPLYELLAEEQRERVRSALCRLKPVQSQVLLMGSSGFSAKEIAAVLDLKPDSLYVLISRAKTQFEKEYVNLYGRAD
jgi:RNA polymerase sigma-70 factor (ECF subfamily)